METELKLSIAPADVASFRRHPLLARHAEAKPRVQRLTTTYFDTPELSLLTQGAALRVRRAGRHWIQTLKAGGQATAGLHTRNEWESRVAASLPDLAALSAFIEANGGWNRVRVDLPAPDRLIPIFQSKFRRTSWLLRLDAGTEVEFALDQGTVEVDSRSVPISEIELELIAGDATRIFEFAMELQSSLPLRVSNISKAARGFELRMPAVLEARKAGPLLMTSKPSVAAGIEAIAGNCLEQVQSNERGVIEGNDAESVHQMRVGVRRLRFALRLFERAAPSPPALRDELEWLGEELGAARDWEVLATSTLRGVEKRCASEPGLAALRQATDDVASRNRQRAAAAVQSDRYTRLLLGLGHWLQTAHAHQTQPPAHQAALAAPLAAFSTRKLKALHAKLIRQVESLEQATPPARHEVRKVARRVRYAAEFFSPLYPPSRMRTYLKSLIALQDALGWLNDVAVATGLMRELAQSDSRLTEAAAFANGFLASSAQATERKLDKRWNQLRRTDRPRLK